MSRTAVFVFLLPLLSTLVSGAAAAAAAVEAPPAPPGVVIHHQPHAPRVYIGSPGIVVLADGTYLAKCDEFGPGSSQKKSGVTHVFRSADRGRTWEKIATLDDLFWASIFLHRGKLYLFGTTKEYGHCVIRRSDDGGRTWTTPKGSRSGRLLADRGYHTAPMPVVEHDGRLWRAMEDAGNPKSWAKEFRAFMMSVPVDANLLHAENWTVSNRLARDETWLDGGFGGWLEGNAVVTPDGRVVNVLRVDTTGQDEKAAIVQISGDGKTATFDPASGFVDFPGGAKKFSIRFDAKTKRYWSLSNIVPKEYRGATTKPAMTRNTLALVSSADLRDWRVERVLLQHHEVGRGGFQYVDWLFEGDDLIAVVRTAFPDGQGGPHNQHDANYLTFHRFENFRRKS